LWESDGGNGKISYILNCAEVIDWCADYARKIASGEAKPFMAILADPPYHLTSITERFGKDGSAPANGGVYNRAAKGFMGKTWDGGDISFQSSTWAAIKDIMYPGAFGMAFAGSRGWHRMACAIEDAGFVLHPTIFCWVYASGFPKATRIDKKVDEQAGAEQKIIGKRADFPRDGCKRDTSKHTAPKTNQTYGDYAGNAWMQNITVPATTLAKVWAGHRYGLQALKPAAEPIIVFQKPYEGKPLENITKTGAGALNIDGGRIGVGDVGRPLREVHDLRDEVEYHGTFLLGRVDGTLKSSKAVGMTALGRWPANLVLCHTPECKWVGTKQIDSTPAHPLNGTTESPSGYGTITQRSGEVAQYADENGKETVDDWECVDGCPVKAINDQSGILQGMWGKKRTQGLDINNKVYGKGWKTTTQNDGTGDSGGASRFFFNADWNLEAEERLFENPPFRYCPKASRSEREAGLDNLDVRACGVMQDDNYQWKHDGKGNEINLNTKMHNHHPTVKPISLNQWLATLLLPPAKYAPRRLLVPFAGVGSEMVGALLAGWDEVVGVEMMPEYVTIGQSRLEFWSKHPASLKVIPKAPRSVPKEQNTLDAYMDL
jgi:hypothetical protein